MVNSFESTAAADTIARTFALRAAGAGVPSGGVTPPRVVALDKV